MAQVIESAVTETKKQIINNPRIEIDTNPPFESVKEAVDHFGGGGRWFPGQNLLRLTSDQVGSSFSASFIVFIMMPVLVISMRSLQVNGYRFAFNFYYYLK